jgi:hypothetical protein
VRENYTYQLPVTEPEALQVQLEQRRSCSVSVEGKAQYQEKDAAESSVLSDGIAADG